MDIPTSHITWRFSFMTKSDAEMLSEIDRSIFPDSGFPPIQMATEIGAGTCGAAWVGPEFMGYYLAREDQDITEIIRLAVMPAWQHRGVGSFLLSFALQNAKTPRVVLHVQKNNRAALGLYHRTGFQIVGEIQDAWVMARSTSS